MCRGQLFVEPGVVRGASTVIVTVNGSGSAPEETPREIAERELLAVREDVQQMAENMRARLKQDEQDARYEKDTRDE